MWYPDSCDGKYGSVLEAVVYDVGAHAGFHTLVSGLLAGPHGSIIAFEPNPQNFKLLQQQITLNPKINARALPYAISDRCHDMRLDTSPGSSQGRLSQQGKIAVDARSIDSLVNSGECPPPSVMKIDVEGHEIPCLHGMRHLLSGESRPSHIICEVSPATARDVCDLMESFGYSPSLLTAKGPRPLKESRAIKKGADILFSFSAAPLIISTLAPDAQRAAIVP